MGYYKDYLYENAITWTTDGANAGTVNYRGEKFYCTNVCGVLLGDKVTPNQMLAEAINNVAKDHVSYVGNPKLMNNVMAEICIWLPSEDTERRAISTFVYSIDHLITLHQSKSFGHILKAIVSCTLSWEQRKLGEVVVIERGGSPRPIEKYITESNDGLNWIKIGDAPVQGRYITKTSEKIKKSGLSKTRQVFPGDLILSNSMSFGKPYIMGIEGCIHDGWLVIKNKNNVFDLKFLCHMLSTEYLFNQYKMFAAGSTVNNLNKELVGNASVRFPKMLEQRKIGKHLESLDRLITLHQLEPFQLIFKAIAYRIIDYTKSKPPSHRK